MKVTIKKLSLALSVSILTACQAQTTIGLTEVVDEKTAQAIELNSKAEPSVAPGAPGQPPVWAYSGKTGIGSSYEQYVDGAYRTNEVTGNVSKVWFSLAQGIVTETMFGLIHQAQIKDMQVVMVGKDFADTEQHDMVSEISYLFTDKQGRPLSPAYKIVGRV